MARITLAAIVVIAAIALAATIAQAATRPTYIGCGDGSTTDFVQHPKFCSTLQPSQSLAEAIALHNLHWHSWGGLSATATARTRAKTNEPWTPVTVRVYRRVWSSCADGYVYTRLRTTIQGRHVIWKMLSCA